MELDADEQGRDNGSNLFVRFFGQVTRRIRFCPISIKRWDKMPKDNTKRHVKWALRTLATNSSDIPPVEWTAFVDHYMDPKTKKQCLQNARNREKLIVSHVGGRSVCRSEVIVSTLLKKDESYVSREGQRLAIKRAATEGIHSKVLTHPDDAIGKVCGSENGKRVRDFSNATIPSDFGKPKRIFGVANCRGSSNVSQQHVADLGLVW
ncbi:hypothetical protein Ahy_B05g076108 [Arachis hypogaea]|uniref:Uncharacterized protein n=1 Tax=Arachis hypogaea TaxID=3818 RepID=A0A444Z2L8_ARAHY|nr:hypothetical protein Ahy_B05g076108 [Arachis hypogaea]